MVTTTRIDMTQQEKHELINYLRRIAERDNEGESPVELGERLLAMDILSDYFGIEI